MVERYRFWCQDSDAEVSREPNGGWVRHSDYAVLEARAEAAERALAERAGGVRPLPERAPYEVLQVLGREYETTGDMWEALRDVLTTEQTAQEGWQEAGRIGDAVLDWMVKFDLLDAGNEYYVSDVLAVLNDLTPSTRPGGRT